MAVDRYRPDQDVTFDLAHGLVHLEGAPGRVLVPADALGVLCASASPEAVASFGGAIGRAMGLRVAVRLAEAAPAGDGEAPREAIGAAGAREAIGAAGARALRASSLSMEPQAAPNPGAQARAASVDAMVDHLGAEMSLAGLGSLGIERWGHALVVVVDHCPLGARGDRLLEAVVGEAIAAATARHARAVLLAREGVRVRLLLTSPAAADRVKGWLQEGVAWGDALTRLHAPPAAAVPSAT